MSSTSKIRRSINPKYGRLLDDFRVGEVYYHPWEVTIDRGMLAMFAASFLDANPLYSSRRFARDLGFRDRVVPPMMLLNLALGFTVHDVSEQTIAHLAYLDLKFPNAAYAGDTVAACSQVLGVRASDSRPDRGVVHVRTTAVNQDGVPVVSFERKALIPAGTLAGRAHPDGHEFAGPRAAAQELPARAVGTPVQTGGLTPVHAGGGLAAEAGALPGELALRINIPKWPGRPLGLFEDYEPGDLLLHDAGRTVGESEHMQLTMLSRNSHPLHYDEVYSRANSFAHTRVVCGGLVFAWVMSLASRDTSANALWEMGFDRGAHPQPVLSGDTLYAASLVVEKHDVNEHAGVVKFRLVGVKNATPAALMESGMDLIDGKFEQKVFEIDRSVLLPRRSTVALL
jgi:2-methylfumaryl-CoA hydratase